MIKSINQSVVMLLSISHQESAEFRWSSVTTLILNMIDSSVSVKLLLVNQA